MKNEEIENLKKNPLVQEIIEEAIKNGAKRNETLLNAIPDLIFRLSKNGEILDYKASEVDSLYVKPEFFLNKNMHEIFPQYLVDIVDPKLDAAFQTLSVQTFDYSLQMEKGMCYYEARIVANPQQDEAIVYVRDITEPTEILNRFLMLSTALEQTTDTVFLTDIKGNIIFVNTALEQTYGYSKQELLGQNPRIFKSGIKDADFYKELWSTILNGESFRSEVINKRKDKTYVYEDRIITPIKDEKGIISSFLSVGRDITDQKTKEVKIAKSEKKLKAILQSSFDGFVVVNNLGRIIEVNDAYCQMSGYSREELSRMSLKDVEAIKSSDDIEVHMKRIMEEGRDQFESAQYRKDGTKYPIEVSVIKAEDGNLISFIKDITKRKQTEHELMIKEWAIEASLNGAMIISLDGMITYVNQSLVKMFAYSNKEDLLNRSIYDFVNNKDKVQNVFKDIISESVYRGEIEIKRNDGESIKVEISCNLVKDTEGIAVSVFCTVDYKAEKKRFTNY